MNLNKWLVNITIIEEINNKTNKDLFYKNIINIGLFIFIGIVIILLCDQITEVAINIGMKRTMTMLEPYLEKIKEKVLPSHPWYDKLSLPRKWYWLPEKPEYLLIKAQNLGGNKNQFTKIPAIYGIICDEIIFSDDKPSNNECLDFCNHMNFIVDPHYKNFTFDKIDYKRSCKCSE